ncbi:MAG TPA: aldo/keto reductase [Burkholderiales bacterium]|jgi:diketogulonate reductase-like aldo/keto reductase|nr:aldo/keto reductase [Burkholderiales bacterium]
MLRMLAAAPLLAAMPALAEGAAPVTKRAIPRSGEMLPVVGLGTYQSFAVGSGADGRGPLKEVLRLFVEHGGKLVDSSPMYGPSEGVVGDLAAELELTDRLFMATKVWTSGRESGIRQMEESMRRMKVRRMDLMQIHNLQDWKTHAKTLQEWKAAGRIRYTGITHYHSGAYDELERLMKTKQFDFVQFNYSISEREAEDSVLPLAQDTGTAVIVNRPFAQAGLFSRVRGKEVPAWAAEFDCRSWGQFFLKYILAHPAVTCVIPATSKPKHLVDNMGAGVGRFPDPAMRRRMTAYIDAL